MRHKYNPWGDDHFQVNRSKDKVTRAIRIFADGARGIPAVAPFTNMV